MKNCLLKKQQILWLVLLTIWLVQLACIGSVEPDDRRLQAPISNIGMELDKFIDQLKGIPSKGIMAPWITSPPDASFNSEQRIVVEGWAPYFRNAQLVLYQVEPNEAVTRADTIIKTISTTGVDSEYNWQISIDLTDEQQFFAARLELPNGKMSPFSNIIFVSLGEPDELIILSPQQDEVITDENITMMGTGQPGIGLNLWINGEKSNITSFIDSTGSWQISDIPFAVGGFDKKNSGSSSNNLELKISSEVTGQSSSVIIRDTEPILLLWPFGTGEGANYKPDITKGMITAFFGNDWHFKNIRDHLAWDISTKSGCVRGSKIHAVSGGEVVVVGNSSVGGYIIIDSGDFGVLYLHVMDIAVRKNDKVIPGQIIAYEGYVNSPDGKCVSEEGAIKVHLHIEVAVWAPNVDKSSYTTFTSQQKVNLNPPITVKDIFIEQNSNLYHFWGPDSYCGQNGCWKDMNWSQLKIYPFESDYDNSCLSDIEKLKPHEFSGGSARYQWCLKNPNQCNLCE